MLAEDLREGEDVPVHQNSSELELLFGILMPVLCSAQEVKSFDAVVGEVDGAASALKLFREDFLVDLCQCQHPTHVCRCN